MKYTKERLREIFDQSSGYCHLCHGKLAFSHYGSSGPEGWEVDHRNPKAKGGSDRLTNLVAAHVSCNREKGTRSSEQVRRENGVSGSPMSKREFERRREEGKLVGFLGGAGIGAAIGGPPGALLGAVIGVATAGPKKPTD